MERLMVYSAESSLCLLLFWLFYRVALRGDTSHSRNRFYLLAAMVLSLLLPLARLSLPAIGSVMTQGPLYSVILPETVVRSGGAVAGEPGSLTELIIYLYIAGLTAGIVKLAAGTVSLALRVFRGRRSGRTVYFEGGENECFSAFGLIFISSSVPSSVAGRMISHEMNHIRLLHHFDLVLAGLISVLQWFNPAARLVSRSLREVHEYEADEACLLMGEDPSSYRSLLLESVLGTRLPVMSDNFSHNSLLKKRLIMMTKKKNGNLSSLKMLLALPLILTLAVLFSCRNQVSRQPAVQTPAAEVSAVVYDTLQNNTSDDIFMVVEEMPVFGNDTTGGELVKWMSSNIVYPQEAKEKGIQGRVMIRFVVDEKGKVGDPAIVRSADPVLDKAAFELIGKCPDWTPGKQGGNPVKVYYVIPVTFALN